MPELPEVESLRLSLAPHLLGATITRAHLARRDICQVFAADGSPIRATKQALAPHLLENGRITSLIRRGKQMAILTEDGRGELVIRLGMTGQVLITSDPSSVHPPIDQPIDQPNDRLRTQSKDGEKSQPNSPSTHVHAMWILRAAASAPASLQMIFRDPRRFGGLSSYPSLAALHQHVWNALGPDGLVITGDDMLSRAGDSQRPIKAALLDQAIVAGVGNIYADEALFASKINPHTLASNLSAKHWSTLAATIRSILTQAITLGGSTLNDYLDANGHAGSATQQHRVYGRGGQICHICGTSLSRGTLAQRTTVWCSQCQPA